MTAIRTVLILLFCILLPVGCSSWGGKMNNTEGVSYYSKGQYDQALEAFQTAARLNPEDSEVYYNIASTYQQQALRYQDASLLTQAETNYRICLQKNPTHETTVCCYRGLASVLNQKKEGDLALKTLKEWEEKEPTSIEPKLEIAYLLEAQGKNEEAADALTKIKEWAPNDYRAFYKLGVVKEKMGDDNGALEELRTAARLNPTNQEITTKINSIEGKKAPSAADSIPSEPGTAAEPANNESVWTAPNTGNQIKTAAEEKSGSVAFTSQPAEQAEIPSDGFTAVPDPNEPVFNPPQPDEVVPQSSPFDSELPDFNPSYNIPAEGSVPAAPPAPVDTKPSAPADTKKEAENVDSLFEVDTLDSGTASSNYAPSELTLTQNGSRSQTLSIPDGTGSQPYKLAYAGTVPASSSTLTAASPMEDNTANTGTPKKSRVGVANPGPPRTSVGVPF